jgi:hypothetical protein
MADYPGTIRVANGYFAAFSSVRGTDTTQGYMVGLMDYTDCDISGPVAIPGWNGIDYYDGQEWHHDTTVSADALSHYRQTLNMRDALRTTAIAG